nr:G-type lectin S-receptor-like serine/threonine-protein kinase At4g27290 isoform X1 [Tanacetum cinerariifolium]
MQHYLPINMKGFSLLLLISIISTLLVTSTAISTITPNQNITDGQTILSDNETFRMGFFSPSNVSRNRYFGIWYNKISVMTVVWVANRDAPVTDNSSVLVLNDKGILMLFNSSDNMIWSSNSTTTRHVPVAQLLDTGDLVIRNVNDRDPENYLWQSFDYPGNTFLPDMKFGLDFVKGLNKYLTSWKSADDPSSGEYTNKMESEGYPQILLREGSEVKFNSGPWNGRRFSGMPNLKPNDIYTFGFVINQKEVYYKFELVNNSVVSRMILSTAGVIQRFIWVERAQEWRLYVTGQMDNCDRYGLCGPYGICNINNSPPCGCLRGFEPRFQEEWRRADWSNGCMRKAELNCSGGDGFVKQRGVKVPDTRKTWFNVSMNLEECEKVCLRNCNCTAYANTDVRSGGSGCLLWLDDLVDIRMYGEDGQDIYVRMAASELHRNAKAKRRVIIIVIPVVVGMTLILGLCLFYRRRKHKKNGTISVGRDNSYANENKGEDWELPLFDFNIIASATNNFSDSCKLGEGGYGPVYKGKLEDGKSIAVKRHSHKSKQGLDEFQNEVQCIAKLQHRNLVKLLGCCIEEDERMLIYEYMPNKSLNSFIFDEGKRKSLDWSKRNNIIIGIARGLLYLHQDSRLRIIHRDLKASNILLDRDMNPKISDFGLARSMEGSDTAANTKRVMGTYGYMAPEYTIDGIYSIKSDVFSFGVLVLEIISGKKNRGFRHANHDLNLLGHAWRLYKNGNHLELIDGTIKSSQMQSEVVRTIHIGLLCVQKYPEDRPSMPMVVLMLGSEIPLPEPKQPGFYTDRRRPEEAESSSSHFEWSSSNRLSVTYLQPR